MASLLSLALLTQSADNLPGSVTGESEPDGSSLEDLAFYSRYRNFLTGPRCGAVRCGLYKSEPARAAQSSPTAFSLISVV